MAKAPKHVRTSYPSRMLGALPNDPSKPRVKLTAKAALTPPASADYYSRFPAGSWGMLGNDQVGDCVAAGALHFENVFEFYGQNKVVGFSTQDAITMYSAISGYRPGNPRTDVGATLQSGLDYMRKVGVQGYKIEAFAEIDYRDTNLLKQCIADFGTVYLALQVPSSAMDQFDRGQPWDVVGRSQIEGGHCVIGVGYDAQYLYVITWGAVQKVTWAFYNKYFVEAWQPIDADWMTASGKTPSGYDWAAANAEYQKLTGDSGAPFPNVGPVTPPVDPPVVPPTPEAADQVLAAALHAWLQAKGLEEVPPHVHGH